MPERKVLRVIIFSIVSSYSTILMIVFLAHSPTFMVLPNDVSAGRRDEQRRVTIAQEPEIVGKSVVIDFSPVALHKSTDKQ